jgi:hypothetical protein
MVHKPQIELLDVVALTAEVGSLATGSLGTVVEFIDDLGRTLAIEVLRRDCLRKV